MLRGALMTLALASLTLACDGGATNPPSPTDARDGAEALAAAAAGGPSVTGGGTITFGTSEEHVSVSAFGPSGNSLGSGNAQFHDKTATRNVDGHVEINCVRVVGNEATISGIVTRSSDPTIEGFEALFQIRDNDDGSRGPDFMSPVLLHEVGVGPNCLVPSEFDLVPVKGNFTVRP
jgi:hypothetical protein